MKWSPKLSVTILCGYPIVGFDLVGNLQSINNDPVCNDLNSLNQDSKVQTYLFGIQILSTLLPT